MKSANNTTKMVNKHTKKETFFIATKVGDEPTNVNFYNTQTGEEVDLTNIKREKTSEGIRYVSQK